MRIVGQFKHRVRIQKKTVVPGPLGQTETWEDVETRWARFVSVSSKAQEEYQQVGYGEVSHEVIFKGKVRLLYGTYRLVYVRNLAQWNNLYWNGYYWVKDGDIFELAGPSKDPEGVNRNTIVPVRTVPQNVLG